MSRPNQIDPYGRAHLIPGLRGASLTGNSEYGNAWITCEMDRSWRKEGRQYLRLFFLDEMTALAAGYRPCNRCRRQQRVSFVDSWNQAHGTSDNTAAIDKALAAQRGTTWESTIDDLPDGTMIDVEGVPHLLGADGIQRWEFSGYTGVSPRPSQNVQVITPAGIVRTMRAGYHPLSPEEGSLR